jgi:hypothetical protein
LLNATDIGIGTFALLGCGSTAHEAHHCKHVSSNKPYMYGSCHALGFDAAPLQRLIEYDAAKSSQEALETGAKRYAKQSDCYYQARLTRFHIRDSQ